MFNARQVVETDGAVDLFAEIGEFLRAQRLSPDPAHYEFAYRVVTDPGGPLARLVTAIVDGGVRLSKEDIEGLGGQAVVGPPPEASAPQATPQVSKAASSKVDNLVAQTQMQVEGFADMIHAMRAETAGFGRDLAASADVIRDTASPSVAEIVQITSAMLERVRTAENRLDVATREATDLRAKLEEARDNARRDPLTDLPNRRAFEEAFAAQALSGEMFCVGVCDVDHFKAVNDRFGHTVGDRVLKAIGEALSQACVGQLVARYGGEEFAVLFSGVECDVARETLETARKTIAGKRYRLRESDEAVGEITISAGLAKATGEEALEAVFERADGLLYAAKQAGRNQLKSD